MRQAMSRTREWLIAEQQDDGHWIAELEGDTILESEYILLLAYLGQHRSRIAIKAAQYIANKQLPDGGWTLYPGGRIDVSASVKGYFALKLAGHDIEAEYMQRAPLGHSRGRRGRRGQQLHAILPGAVGPDPVRVLPGGSSRGAAVAALHADQLVLGERLEPNDPRAAVGDVGLSASGRDRSCAGHP